MEFFLLLDAALWKISQISDGDNKKSQRILEFTGEDGQRRQEGREGSGGSQPMAPGCQGNHIWTGEPRT